MQERTRKIVFWSSIVIVIVGIIFLLSYFIKQKNSEDNYENLRNEASEDNFTEKNEIEEDFFVEKPKKKKKNTKVNVNLNSTDIEFVNNLYEVATNLLHRFEKASEGKHTIRVGIRPEDVVLAAEFDGNKTDNFVVNANIVELLGSELLVHSDFAEANLVAKISTNVLIKPHTDVELAFNQDKILIFDESCGDRI